jgi:polyisoprenoid-binding protein YceI
MKRNHIVLLSVALVVVIGAGGYAAMDRYLGNSVEVESVMEVLEESVPSEQTDATETAGSVAAVSAEQLNGNWSVADGSKVYWSVTTSKETVNFVNEAVTGSWTVDVNDAAVMTGEGVVDMTSLDSSNSQRDGHVKGEDFLAVANYPEATFQAASISPLPAELTEGTAVPVEIAGTLTVKDIGKDVTFVSNAMYKEGQLLLSGSTKVTFTDFGMTSPHTIVLEAENELSVQLELILNKA